MNYKRRNISCFISLFLCFFSFGQDHIITTFDVEDGDTVINTSVPELELIVFKDSKEQRKYYYLKKKVLKVYPYAIMAKEKLTDIELGLDTIPKRRHKKRYTKSIAKWVKEEYSGQLKNLTISEGRILVKLVYRETKKSSYELVKSYRGKFNAFFWQTVAKLYDNDLKSEYDPVNIREDMLIEHIIIQAKIEGKFD